MLVTLRGPLQGLLEEKEWKFLSLAMSPSLPPCDLCQTELRTCWAHCGSPQCFLS